MGSFKLIFIVSCLAAHTCAVSIQAFTSDITSFITRGDVAFNGTGCFSPIHEILTDDDGYTLIECLDEAKTRKAGYFMVTDGVCTISFTPSLPACGPNAGRIFRVKRAKPYNKAIAPKQGDMEVTLSSTILKFNSIDTKAQTYAYSVYFRQEWTDERLAWNIDDFGGQKHLNLTITSTAKAEVFMWTSDAFFSTATEIENPDSDESFTVQSDGYILWSRLLQITSFCDMNMLYYPFDYQECITDIESYAYDASILLFNITSDRSETPAIEFDENPTACSRCNINTLNSYKLELPRGKLSNKTYRGVTFSGVRWVFTFVREPATYFLNIFLPLWLICLLSLGSCYIDVASSPARVGMGITTVLVLISQMNGLKADIPVVSYITAMDVYFILCLVYVVINVAEYGVINFLMVKLQTRDKLRKLKREYIEKESDELKQKKEMSFSMKRDNETTGGNSTSVNSTEPVDEEAGGDTAATPKGAFPPSLSVEEDAYLKECFMTFNTKHEKITSHTLQPVLLYMGVPDEHVMPLVRYVANKEKEDQALSYERFSQFIQKMGILQKYGVRAITVCGRGVTMSSLHWFESKYRVATPLVFFLMNIIWFIIVLALANDGKTD
eukprot:TRINITY_DN10376_c0_g2_i2.p1 TRINITY_DN10376_c0_g2~~TRINITY_DN10376_c0_g2_i2.p1  ORF type:complete len:612 (+),score=181.40 TRINITY_DN10376_c0_g2_i2:54-1889(+)